jgi:hypothetical protein
VPRLLKRHGLTVSDIDLWEINEAFSVVSLYNIDFLKIDPAKVCVSVCVFVSSGYTYNRERGKVRERKRDDMYIYIVSLCRIDLLKIDPAKVCVCVV